MTDTPEHSPLPWVYLKGEVEPFIASAKNERGSITCVSESLWSDEDAELIVKCVNEAHELQGRIDLADSVIKDKEKIISGLQAQAITGGCQLQEKAERIAELEKVLTAFVDAEVDYMQLNKLGDPEQQHNVQWARKVLKRGQS